MAFACLQAAALKRFNYLKHCRHPSWECFRPVDASCLDHLSARLPLHALFDALCCLSCWVTRPRLTQIFRFLYSTRDHLWDSQACVFIGSAHTYCNSWKSSLYFRSNSALRSKSQLSDCCTCFASAPNFWAPKCLQSHLKFAREANQNYWRQCFSKGRCLNRLKPPLLYPKRKPRVVSYLNNCYNCYNYKPIYPLIFSS